MYTRLSIEPRRIVYYGYSIIVLHVFYSESSVVRRSSLLLFLLFLCSHEVEMLKLYILLVRVVIRNALHALHEAYKLLAL